MRSGYASLEPVALVSGLPPVPDAWKQTRAAARVLLVAICAVLLVTGAAGDSLTTDEYGMIPPGYHYWTTGRSFWWSDHPPFLKLLETAPLLALRLPKIPNFWELPFEEAIDAFMFHPATPVERVAWLARLPIIALTLLLVCFLGWWASRWYGPVPGLLALFLAVFSPDVLAHGRYATSDLGVAALMAIALFLGEAACRLRSVRRTVGAGLILGLALLSKFSAILLGPMLLLQLLLPERITSRRAIALSLAVIALTALAVIELGYRIPLRHMSREERAAQIRILPAANPTREVALGLLPILPGSAQYVYGLGKQWENARRGHAAFLWGRYSEHGWWYYYLATFAIKTPLPLLLLIGMAMGRPPTGIPRREWRTLMGPVLVFVAASFFSSLNIGHRHLLPIYPLLIVWVSRVARPPFQILRTGALALLCVWYSGGTLLIHPHELAYFNEAVGGPNLGWKYLTDSNVDWGQETKRLAVYARAHDVHPLSATITARSTPAAYRHYLPEAIRFWPPFRGVPQGYYAVGRTVRTVGPFVAHKRLDRADANLLLELLARLDRLTPIATIGYAVDLFDLRPQSGDHTSPEGLGLAERARP